MKYQHRFAIALMAALISWLIPPKSFAALSLSVTPIDGGTTIRFGRVHGGVPVDKEIRIRITSTEGRQYQLYQRMLEPFVSDQGRSLDRSAVLAAALPGSNMSGSMYLQDLEPLSFSDQLIYSSDQSGIDDSFTVIYRVDPGQIDASGNFYGKIILTARTVGSAARDEFILNVFLESTGELKIRSDSSSGRRRVTMEAGASGQAEAFIEIAYDGTIGDLSIDQELIAPLENEEGRIIPPDKVSVMMSSAYPAEIKYALDTPLGLGREEVYSSDSAQDVVQFHFGLTGVKTSDMSAGVYRSKLRYFIVDAGQEEILEYDFIINVPKIFNLKVDYPPEGIAFDRLLPDAPAQMKDLLVTVSSNTSQPYIVSQNLINALSSEEGVEFNRQHFQMKQEILDGEGTIQFSEFSSIPLGEMPVYYSDKAGSPVRFRVIYKQAPYPDMQPGSYKAAVRYSLEEM